MSWSITSRPIPVAVAELARDRAAARWIRSGSCRRPARRAAGSAAAAPARGRSRAGAGRRSRAPRRPVGEISEAESREQLQRKGMRVEAAPGSRAAWALISTFSSTLSWPKRRMFWNVRPMPARATSWAGHRVASRPSIRMRPALGEKRPEMMLRSVVLPDPFGPISPTISPGRRLRSTPSRARRPAKFLIDALGAEFAGWRHGASPVRCRRAASSPARATGAASGLAELEPREDARRPPVHDEQDQDAKAGLGEPEHLGRLPAEDVDAALRYGAGSRPSG